MRSGRRETEAGRPGRSEVKGRGTNQRTVWKVAGWSGVEIRRITSVAVKCVDIR